MTSIALFRIRSCWACSCIAMCKLDSGDSSEILAKQMERQTTGSDTPLSEPQIRDGGQPLIYYCATTSSTYSITLSAILTVRSLQQSLCIVMYMSTRM